MALLGQLRCDSGDIVIYGKGVVVVRLMDVSDACFDATDTVIIFFQGVISLVISMIGGCLRAWTLGEVIGLCEVSFNFGHVCLMISKKST